MKIGVLTSSRADFGIYSPLLNLIKNDNALDLKIIAFGTHCSPFYGKTINEIYKNGFTNVDSINTILATDDVESIATSYGLTVMKFAEYWNHNTFDVVFCLGDRYEMSAAVQAGIPYGVKFAHIHGGETTLGAIDNIYRHQITLASSLHFTTTEEYANKVKELTGNSEGVFNVGSLSLDGIEEIIFPDEDEFRKKFNIPRDDYILTTFHPETVAYKQNIQYALEMRTAIEKLQENYVFVITMPNADTNGSAYRKHISELQNLYPQRIIAIENFGKENYFTAMQYSKFLLGNSSSGIIEAASFGKYVVNVGNRQKNRSQSKNIINTDFSSQSIIKAVSEISRLKAYSGDNIYYRDDTAKIILKTLKSYNEKL